MLELCEEGRCYRMKYEEAIILMKKTCYDCSLHWEYGGEECKSYGCYTALDMAIEALEKQIPKKRIVEEIKEGYNRGMHNYYCPVCYEKGNLKNKNNLGYYCKDCGQRLE